MDDCCVVVTGAASGIGRAVCQNLLAKGENVVAVDVNADRLQQCYAGNSHVYIVSCDLLSPEASSILGGTIKTRFSAVKGFVHAAGFDMMAPLGMIKEESLQRLVAIHAGFPMQFLGWLAKKTNHSVGTSCVFISSLSAHEGAKGHVAYAAAKGAVEGLLRPAAAELMVKGIRLNAVVLGVVETEMAKGWLGKLTPEQYSSLVNGYPFGLGRPESVAEIISFFLSQSASWITGQTLVCDGGHLLT